MPLILIPLVVLLFNNLYFVYSVSDRVKTSDPYKSQLEIPGVCRIRMQILDTTTVKLQS